jgi:hypothetical protein
MNQLLEEDTLKFANRHFEEIGLRDGFSADHSMTLQYTKLMDRVAFNFDRDSVLWDVEEAFDIKEHTGVLFKFT